MVQPKEPSEPIVKNEAREDLLQFTDTDIIPVSSITRLAGDRAKYREFIAENPGTPHSLLIFSLTHETFPEMEARSLWRLILEHEKDLSHKLERTVGVTVAALDYMTNIRSVLSEPKIIEEEKSDHISEAATRDVLTGLYMRDVFDLSLHKTLSEAGRFGSSVCLAMIDIDDFKEVNDTLGHQTGDRVLQAMGRILTSNIREMDIAARYGGEELAVIMPRTAIGAARYVAERIRASIEKENIAGAGVTVSIGLCQNGDGRDTPEELVQAADKALYRAKKLGKNRVVS